MSKPTFWDDLHLFMKKIDFNNTKVSLKFARVFLCGGAITHDPNIPPKYVRDYILRQSNDDKTIVLAEEIFNQQFDDGVYDSLLSLETAISSFCSSILIVLESPGAIAELGSFCVINETKNKLYVLIHQNHNNQNSYIKNGPLKHINNTRVWSYDWSEYSDEDPSRLSNSIDRLWAAMDEDLKELYSVDSSPKDFNINEYLHTALIVSWITQVTFPQTFQKIYDSIKAAFPNITKEYLRLSLRLGEHFKIIRKIEIKNAYYVGLVELDNLSMESLPGKYLDLDSISVLASNYLSEVKESDRKLYAAYERWKGDEI